MKESNTTLTGLLPLKKKALERVLKLGVFIAVCTNTDTFLGSHLMKAEGKHVPKIFADLIPQVLVEKRV